MTRLFLLFLSLAVMPAWSSGSSLPAFDAKVQALAASGDSLFVASRTTLDDPNTQIHRLVQDRWNDLGATLVGSVYAMATDGERLFVAGCFELEWAGGHIANLAQWSAAGWSPLGEGVEGCVYSLGLAGDSLYVGGAFTNAGHFNPEPAPCDGPRAEKTDGIAVWREDGWHALGQGVLGAVYAIAIEADSLIIGGHFSRADGAPVANVARWTGQTWTGLAEGIDGTVYALAGSAEGEVYAGGRFSSASGVAVNNLARWNGEGWSALGHGIDGTVQALVGTPNGILVGGDFTATTTQDLSYLANWNGQGWEAVNSGLDGNVTCLGRNNNGTFAAGEGSQGVTLIQP